MAKSINKLIDEQVKRWEMEKREARPVKEAIDVITVSRESGSQGYEIAERLCRDTGFSLFHNEIVDAMVETSKKSRILLETLDEKRMNIVDDIVSNFVSRHHLWPDEYSRLLFKIITTISKHGRAVILGRGANCVLKDETVLRVRIVAPANVRLANVMKRLNLKKEDAKKHTVTRDANRAAFVKRYFNSDSTDPSNYDLILNTGTLSVEKSVEIIKEAIR